MDQKKNITYFTICYYLYNDKTLDKHFQNTSILQREYMLL